MYSRLHSRDRGVSERGRRHVCAAGRGRVREGGGQCVRDEGQAGTEHGHPLQPQVTHTPPYSHYLIIAIKTYCS